jgi:hypothetical protein
VSAETGLDAWFLHEKLILGLLYQHEIAVLGRQLPLSGEDRSLAALYRIELLERAVSAFLARTDVPSLAVSHLQQELRIGQVVWLDQTLSFKGTGTARAAVERGRSGRATFSGPLATDENVRVYGEYNAERLTGSSSLVQLKGRQRQFLLGYVHSMTAEEIGLRPIVIARRWARPTPASLKFWDDTAHVWPSAVDQFGGVNFRTRLAKADLDALKVVPEKRIKQVFAEIISESEVPNDWGGEQFDLWSTVISVEGQRLRAAIAFKGPSRFHPMTIASLGKNGDQIDRLAQTAADLMVVQHCHTITAPVVNMLKAYASNFRDPKRYMLIDGFDTIRILRHFGYLDLPRRTTGTPTQQASLLPGE